MHLMSGKLIPHSVAIIPSRKAGGYASATNKYLLPSGTTLALAQGANVKPCCLCCFNDNVS